MAKKAAQGSTARGARGAKIIRETLRAGKTVPLARQREIAQLGRAGINGAVRTLRETVGPFAARALKGALKSVSTKAAPLGSAMEAATRVKLTRTDIIKAKKGRGQGRKF